MTGLKLSTAAGDATGPAEKVVTKDDIKAPGIADVPQADGSSSAPKAAEEPVANA